MNKDTQWGFTLIELLVVVSVLAAMAMVAVGAVGSYDQRAREELVITEMKNIASAIYRFKQDTGYFPEQGLFPNANADEKEKSDLGFLFFSPRVDGPDASTLGNEIMPWNLKTGRGWNGPYMSSDSIQRMSLDDCDLDAGVGSLQVFGVNATRDSDKDAIIALDDTYEVNREYSSGDICFVYNDQGTWLQRGSAGQAILYDTDFKNSLFPQCPVSGSGCIALLSAGKNGIYENGANDDHVRILGVN